MNIKAHNKAAWDREVTQGNPWTVPVSGEAVAAARKGEWSVLLTPIIPVPRAWFGTQLAGSRILGLASGGGQQGPILAAAGATVTVLDQSGAQLAQDREVARRENLALDTMEGDMCDLSRFADATFDLVFHPVSNCFVPDIAPVWKEAFRVLRSGGALLAGFCNPLIYLFTEDLDGNVDKTLRHTVPYADPDTLSADMLAQYERDQLPLEFGHTLEQQLGGQLRAGFHLTDLYEDYRDETDHPMNAHSPSFIATRAVKPVRV